MALKLHFHTDNHSFSGSEVMLMSLLRWTISEPDVIPSFTYRSSAGYDAWLRAHLPSGLQVMSLRLPDPTDLAARWKGTPTGLVDHLRLARSFTGKDGSEPW